MLFPSRKWTDLSLWVFICFLYIKGEKNYTDKVIGQCENNICKCAQMTCILSGQLCIFVKSECAVQWLLLCNLVNGIGDSEVEEERIPENTVSPKMDSWSSTNTWPSLLFLWTLPTQCWPNCVGTVLHRITLMSDPNSKFGASPNHPLIP